MNFPGCAPQTGGRWLTALAARWLVDSSNSARCRRARAWPPQRPVGAKAPGSPEQRGRRELSSSPWGRGVPALSGWERSRPFEFCSLASGESSASYNDCAAEFPPCAATLGERSAADTPGAALCGDLTRRVLRTASGWPVRAASVARWHIAAAVLLSAFAAVFFAAVFATPASAQVTLVSNLTQTAVQTGGASVGKVVILRKRAHACSCPKIQNGRQRRRICAIGGDRRASWRRCQFLAEGKPLQQVGVKPRHQPVHAAQPGINYQRAELLHRAYRNHLVPRQGDRLLHRVREPGDGKHRGRPIQSVDRELAW